MVSSATDRDLIAVVMPDGGLQLEWATADTAIGKSRNLLQDELYRCFVSDHESWLLRLGLADTNVPLSASLSYWREFAGQFTRRLIRTPDLETLREAIRLDLPAENMAAWLSRAPMMTGLDYLDDALLVNVWERLHAAWRSVMRAHDGTVADFIKAYRPNAHLVGRIFFHLVENKDTAHPFAFLATYSIRLNHAALLKLPVVHDMRAANCRCV